MTDAQALYEFIVREDLLPHYQCRHPARQDGLCIFHLFKPTEEQKQVMAQEARAAAETIEEEFREAFLKLLEDEENNPETKACDFRYFRFPAIDLRGRQFTKPLKIHGTFSGEAIFLDAAFSEEVNFVFFDGGATFGGATFSKRVDFTLSNFSRQAHFWGTTFSGEARFWGAHFSEKANFQNATFNGEADFGDATFNGEADFQRATFSKRVDFTLSNFSKKANFRGAIFSKKANFRGAIFSEKVNFRGETFKGACDFIGLTLDEKARVVFEKANLKQTSFLDTNLEQIHFRDVKWLRKGRRYLWDEFPHEEGQPDYEKVAENYRQLVLNYEAKRDFDTAEDFHIGEMEMRRKKKRKEAEDAAAKAKWLGIKMLWRCWGVINGYSIYKLLSNYGTNYVHGLLVLVHRS